MPGLPPLPGRPAVLDGLTLETVTVRRRVDVLVVVDVGSRPVVAVVTGPVAGPVAGSVAGPVAGPVGLTVMVLLMVETMVVVTTEVAVPVPSVMVSVLETVTSVVVTPEGRAVATPDVAPGPPVLRGTLGVMAVVRVTGALVGMGSWVEALEMMEAEMLEASLTGHTVVDRTKVLVTTTVAFSDSGSEAMAVLSAGQLVTVGAQLVMVWIWVAMTVRVVCCAELVVLALGKWIWRGGE